MEGWGDKITPKGRVAWWKTPSVFEGDLGVLSLFVPKSLNSHVPQFPHLPDGEDGNYFLLKKITISVTHSTLRLSTPLSLPSGSPLPFNTGIPWDSTELERVLPLWPWAGYWIVLSLRFSNCTLVNCSIHITELLRLLNNSQQ